MVGNILLHGPHGTGKTTIARAAAANGTGLKQVWRILGKLDKNMKAKFIYINYFFSGRDCCDLAFMPIYRLLIL